MTNTPKFYQYGIRCTQEVEDREEQLMKPMNNIPKEKRYSKMKYTSNKSVKKQIKPKPQKIHSKLNSTNSNSFKKKSTLISSFKKVNTKTNIQNHHENKRKQNKLSKKSNFRKESKPNRKIHIPQLKIPNDYNTFNEYQNRIGRIEKINHSIIEITKNLAQSNSIINEMISLCENRSDMVVKYVNEVSNMLINILDRIFYPVPSTQNSQESVQNNQAQMNQNNDSIQSDFSL